MISLRKYLFDNILNNTNRIYRSTAGETTEQNSYDICVNEIYNEKYYIKLDSWGDFEISIYKITKPNNIIKMLMDDQIDFIKLNIYVEICENNKIDNNKKNLKLFCKTFGKPIIFTKEYLIYDEDEYKCKYLYKNDWYKTPLKDKNFENIKPYKIIFYKIFNKFYNDNLRHKCVYYDGNFIVQIIEFEDEYYVIDMNTS